MFDFFRGVVARKTPTAIVLDVAGTGWLLECSLRTSARARVGDAITLLAHHRQTEDAQRLFGFSDEDERLLFRRLMRVSGVGPAHALSLLSAHDPSQVWQALRDGDERRLTATKGIGPKIAQRLITELKDEAGRHAVATSTGSATADAAASARSVGEEDAIGALMVLGYNEATAAKAVLSARKKLPSDVAVDVLVREALQHG